MSRSTSTWVYFIIVYSLFRVDTPRTPKNVSAQKKGPGRFRTPRTHPDRTGKYAFWTGKYVSRTGNPKIEQFPTTKKVLAKKKVSGWFQSLSQSSDGSEVGNIAFHSGGILKVLAPLMYLKTFSSSASDHKSPQGYSAYMVKMSVVLSTLGWETNLARHYFYARICFNGSQPLICVIASNITNTQNANTKPYPWPFVEAQLERHLVLRFWHPCRVPWFSWCIATGKA